MRRDIQTLTIAANKIRILPVGGLEEVWPLDQLAGPVGQTVVTPMTTTVYGMPTTEGSQVADPKTEEVHEVTMQFHNGQTLGIDYRDTSYGTLALLYAAVLAEVP